MVSGEEAVFPAKQAVSELVMDERGDASIKSWLRMGRDVRASTQNAAHVYRITFIASRLSHHVAAAYSPQPCRR